MSAMLQSTSQLGASSAESARPVTLPVRNRWVGGIGPAARRFLAIAAIAFWLGGFTFYSSVAIPMGVEVLGTHRAVGFITERVTNWLNVAGVAALIIFAWNMALGWRDASRVLRVALLVTWLFMAVIEIELIALHPMMDRLITTHPVREVLDEDRFDFLHHVYLISTTAQWCFGMIHVWCICVLWKQPSARAMAGTYPLGMI
jgi:hypothetical protein